MKRLLIQGNLTDGEFSEIISDINDSKTEIIKLENKSFEILDFINLIFDDFSIITFTRDLFLGVILSKSYITLNKIIKKIKSKNKNIKSLLISHKINFENQKEIDLVINCCPENLDIVINQINTKINIEVLKKSNKQIILKVDENNNLIIEGKNHQSTKQKNIPNLRFPEFNDEWKKTTLGETGKILGGGTPDTTIISYWNGKIQWFTPTEIKSKYIENSYRTISEEGLKNSSAKILPKGTLLITTRATVGDIGIALKECCTNQGFQSIIVNNENCNEFIYYWILNNKKELIIKGSGSTFLEVSNKEISKLIIKIPSLPEQQKIAELLTAVDKKIETLQLKINNLQKYKKVVMQQIFSQQIRFKSVQSDSEGTNGNDFADWEEKTLGEIGEIITGKTPSTSNENFWNGDIQFVTPTDMNESNKYQQYTQRTIIQFEKTKILPPKTIMFTCIASIGKMSLSIKPCITNQQINSIIPFENFDNEFIYYSLKNITGYIQSTQANTTLPIINKTEFSKFKISVPCLLEQEKIASFLSSIDKKIENCELQLSKIKTWKKGLLQQMFV